MNIVILYLLHKSLIFHTYIHWCIYCTRRKLHLNRKIIFQKTCIFVSEKFIFRLMFCLVIILACSLRDNTTQISRRKKANRRSIFCPLGLQWNSCFTWVYPKSFSFHTRKQEIPKHVKLLKVLLKNHLFNRLLNKC